MDKRRLLELAGVIPTPYRAGSGKNGMLTEAYGRVRHKQTNTQVTNVYVEVADGDDYQEIELDAHWRHHLGSRATLNQPEDHGDHGLDEIELTKPVTVNGKTFNSLTPELMAMVLSLQANHHIPPGPQTEDQFHKMIEDQNLESAIEWKYHSDDRY